MKDTKDIIIKMRVNKETSVNINNMAEDLNLNKSEMLRQSIPNKINTKMFNSMLSLTTLYALERLSKECADELKKNKMHNYDDFIDKYPVFITNNFEDSEMRNLKEVQTLSLKYPTYKIRLLKTSVDKKDVGERENNKFIRFKSGEEIEYPKDKMILYETQCVFIENIHKPIWLYEFLLLEDSLRENEELLNEMCVKLKNSNIDFETWPGYYLKTYDIKIKYNSNNKYILNSEFDS